MQRTTLFISFAGLLAGCAAGDFTGTDDDDFYAPGAPSDGEMAGGDDDDGEEIPAGQLTAAEWSDHGDWDFWLDLLDDERHTSQIEPWAMDTSQRLPVRVRRGGEPVTDAVVELIDADDAVRWTARSDADGRAWLFIDPFSEGFVGPWAVRLADGPAVPLPPKGEVVLDAATQASPRGALDLMFLVDTTGSMGDELSYLQAELADVLARVEDSFADELTLRLSVNFYRDEGDQYVVRSFPFTDDADESIDQLGDQASDGGGDTPEAVEEGLEDAIFEHTWRDVATSRLLFLVLDAPPHQTDGRIAQLQLQAEAMAARGIRVVPVGGSGVDRSTEFLMRSLDVLTGGTYVFLTNHSGIGGDHLEPIVGEYEVEYLNDLLVRVISESLGD